MFRAGLLLIIRRTNSVYTLIGIVMRYVDYCITHDYTNYCIYRVDPPDDEQQACSKHVEAYYRNKLMKNGAFLHSCYRES
jgi:hypothetical protein